MLCTPPKGRGRNKVSRTKNGGQDVRAPIDDADWIHTSARTKASGHHGARGGRAVFCSLRLRFTDRSPAVLSCLPGRFHVLDWDHAGQPGSLDVAASDRRRLGPDNSARAGSGNAHFTANVDSVSANLARIESDLQLDE